MQVQHPVVPEVSWTIPNVGKTPGKLQYSVNSKQSVNVLRDEKEISGGCFFGNFSVFTNAMRYLVGSIKKSVISMGAFENSC